MKKYKYILILTISLQLFSFTTKLYANELPPSCWALLGINTYNNYYNGLCILSKMIGGKHLYGAITTTGETAIEFKYKRLGGLKGFKPGYTKAETDLGQGIIDIQENYLLAPSLNYDINNNSEHPEIYTIRDKSTNKYGLFYKGRMITDIEYDYISSSEYPFIELRKNSKYIYFNTNTSNLIHYDLYHTKWSDYHIFFNYEEQYIYDRNGNFIPEEQMTTNKNGIKLFKDSTTNKYGLINTTNNQIIVPAKYKTNLLNGIWINNIICLNEPTNNTHSTDVLFDNNGNIVFRDTTKSWTCTMSKNFINLSHQSKVILMNYNGEIIYRHNSDSFLYPLSVEGTNLIYLNSNSINKYINTKGKVIKGEDFSYSENMVKYTKDNKTYYINIKTNKELGPFHSGKDFYEGIATVSDGSYEYIIDKNGKEYYKGIKDLRFIGESSEGVINIYYTNKGFIYNPTIKDKYTYNQKIGFLSDYEIRNFYEKALDEFNKKNYKNAQFYYKQIFITKPTEYEAINSYGTCYANMGEYRTAISYYKKVLESDPDNKYSKDMIVWANQRIEETEQSNNIYDNNTSNNNSNYSNNYNNNNEASKKEPNNNNIRAKERNYKTQYETWERRAKSNYESLTSTGYSYSNKKGGKTGSTGHGMNTGNYVRRKQLLREAQNNMRSIRQKAARLGINIPQSRWETVTVSY